MNISLWGLQILLALHTLTGAAWKLSHSEQTVSSLRALPHGVWLALSGIELLCSLCLIVPAFSRRLAIAAPIAAAAIGAEMLLFSGLHAYSGSTQHAHLVYWLVVASICSFIAYGRFVLQPLETSV